MKVIRREKQYLLQVEQDGVWRTWSTTKDDDVVKIRRYFQRQKLATPNDKLRMVLQVVVETELDW